MTSRRDELSNLRDDLQDRLTRRRQERQAAKLAWEAIQRIELARPRWRAYQIVDQTAHSLGCELVQIHADAPKEGVWANHQSAAAPSHGGLVVGAIGCLSTLRWQRTLDHGWACRQIAQFWRPTSSFATFSACARRSRTGWNGSSRLAQNPIKTARAETRAGAECQSLARMMQR